MLFREKHWKAGEGIAVIPAKYRTNSLPLKHATPSVAYRKTLPEEMRKSIQPTYTMEQFNFRNAAYFWLKRLPFVQNVCTFHSGFCSIRIRSEGRNIHICRSVKQQSTFPCRNQKELLFGQHAGISRSHARDICVS